jgi:acyl-CoA-binding protein
MRVAVIGIGVLGWEQAEAKAGTMLGNIQGVNPGFHASRAPPTHRFHQQESDMADLQAAFEQAVADSKQLSERPDNMTLLKIYSLYKQATEGDVQGKRPGFTDMVGRAKYDAWAELTGQSADQARQAYIDLVESLK